MEGGGTDENQKRKKSKIVTELRWRNTEIRIAFAVIQNQHQHLNQSTGSSTPGQGFQFQDWVFQGKKQEKKHTIKCSLNACERWLPSLACLEHFLVTILTRISSLRQSVLCLSLHSSCIAFILLTNIKDLYSFDNIDLFKNPTYFGKDQFNFVESNISRIEFSL